MLALVSKSRFAFSLSLLAVTLGLLSVGRMLVSLAVAAGTQYQYKDFVIKENFVTPSLSCRTQKGALNSFAIGLAVGGIASTMAVLSESEIKSLLADANFSNSLDASVSDAVDRSMGAALNKWLPDVLPKSLGPTLELQAAKFKSAVDDRLDGLCDRIEAFEDRLDNMDDQRVSMDLPESPGTRALNSSMVPCVANSRPHQRVWENIFSKLFEIKVGKHTHVNIANLT